MEIKPMTREQLIANKSCCGSICLNCPYLPKHKKDAIKLDNNSIIKNI